MFRKILVVDNDFDVCNSFSMLLRGEGYCVDETTDSWEAATLIKNDKYDVCFLDYKLDGLNGLDLLRIAKEVNSFCKVFIVSGMSNLDKLCHKEISSGLLAGIIIKPFDVDAILQDVAALVK